MTSTQSGARVLDWNTLDADQPMERITRRRIVGEQAMIAHVELAQGFQVPSHRHVNEQFAIVLAGKIEFGLGDDDRERVTLTAGQVLHLPSNVAHSARAIVDTVILDVFSPPSETTGVDQRD